MRLTPKDIDYLLELCDEAQNEDKADHRTVRVVDILNEMKLKHEDIVRNETY